jgi:hypothetical protein
MRKKAVALLDAAADRGDVGAIVEKWGDGTRNKRVHESDPATVSRLNMLDRGVSAGSRWLRYQRGLVYETQGSERAIEDLYDAAELGHWDALVACRARHRTLSEEDLLHGFGVIVLPIPAALAMTLDRAVVVASAADSAAVFRALGIGASEPTAGATVVAQGETESGQKWIQAAWPDLRAADPSAALGLLHAAYQQILAAAQEGWVVLHPPPDLLFGPLLAHAPALTAGAILLALQEERRVEERRVKVAMCVFDQPSAVVTYDLAFARFAGEFAGQ